MSGFSTSLSGIQSAFLQQSVSSNDIANLNTDGFKQGRVQQSSVAGGGTRTSTTTDFNQGALVQTGRSNDVAINGNGFLVQQGNNGPTFTRTGSLGTDAQGNLVNQLNGSKILGFTDSSGSPQPIQIPERNEGSALTSFSIGEDGTITGEFANGEREEIGQLAVARFDNPSGLLQKGNTSFEPSSNSGDPDLGVPGKGSRGQIVAGALEASNTDLVDEVLAQVTSKNSLAANVSALKTQDEMLGEVLDLKG